MPLGEVRVLLVSVSCLAVCVMQRHPESADAVRNPAAHDVGGDEFDD